VNIPKKLKLPKATRKAIDILTDSEISRLLDCIPSVFDDVAEQPKETSLTTQTTEPTEITSPSTTPPATTTVQTVASPYIETAHTMTARPIPVATSVTASWFSTIDTRSIRSRELRDMLAMFDNILIGVPVEVTRGEWNIGNTDAETAGGMTYCTMPM
jgi:hypothetical protein